MSQADRQHVARQLHEPPVSPAGETADSAYRRGYHDALKDAVEALQQGGFDPSVFNNWMHQVRLWKARADEYRTASPALDVRPDTGAERMDRIARVTAKIRADESLRDRHLDR